MEKDELNVDLNKTDHIMAEAIDKSGEVNDNLIRLSTGVILEARQANPSVLIRTLTAHKRPTPPLYFDKQMNREMENPDDPDYISRVKAWEMEYSNGMLNALIGLGTTLKSKPTILPSPEDDSWIRDYSILDLPTYPDSKSWRYITWVMYIAAPTAEDIARIGDTVKNLSGVKEALVRDAESFPAGD